MSSSTSPTPTSTRPGRANILLFAIAALGLSAFLTQLVLMRELLGVFAGNELVFGVVLGNWMLLMGLGAALGRAAARRRAPVALFVILQTLVALLPPVAVVILRTLRWTVFLRGAEVGPAETVVSCFLLLAPYCLATGCLLPLATHILAAAGDRRSIGRVYYLDNFGEVLGGLLFSFLLVFIWSHFGILYLAAAVNLPLAVLVAWRFGHRGLAGGVAVVLVAAAGVMAAGNLDDWSRGVEYAGQHVAYHGHSPYGSLVVTESAGQYNFLENGVPLFSTRNVDEVEETVHYALAQRPDARPVLLVSGGVSGTAREILKYPAAAVDYVELDPLVLDVAGRFLPESLADRRIRVINTDGRLWVKQTGERYDVVIVAVPDPSTSQLNRFYTREFFAEVKRRLAPDGVLCFSLGRFDAYISNELARLLATADRTAGDVFRNVLVLPAGRNYFLASDGPLTEDVAGRIEAAGIRTRLVNRHYLHGMLTPDRLADVRRATAADAPANTDFNPILYYYHLRYWMSQFKVGFGLLEGGLLVLLAVYLVRLRPVSLAVFTTGFSASALEVVLLVGFQILYGSVYRQVGLIITMFMLGLGIGSLATTSLAAHHGRRLLPGLQALLALYAAGTPLLLLGLERLGGVSTVVSQVAIPLAALVLAVLVGMQFPLAARALTSGADSATAARLYTADYVGAALGALLVSTLLIPLLGVTTVCLLTAGFNVVAGGVLWVTDWQPPR